MNSNSPHDVPQPIPPTPESLPPGLPDLPMPDLPMPDLPMPDLPMPDLPMPDLPMSDAVEDAVEHADAVALRVRDLLVHTSQILVLAESCTAGLIAATLSRIPGVSGVLAGSAVVYQADTKAAWLGIGRRLLQDPGPVSREVAEEMASRVLAITPRASVALSITGHLGPASPVDLDGVAWCAVTFRESAVAARRLLLNSGIPDGATPAWNLGTTADLIRRCRQVDGVRQALQFLADELSTRDEQGSRS